MRTGDHNVTVSTFNCPKCPDGIISSSDKDRLCEYTALPSLNVSYVDNVDKKRKGEKGNAKKQFQKSKSFSFFTWDTF